jgi:hypothetical protein
MEHAQRNISPGKHKELMILPGNIGLGMYLLISQHGNKHKTTRTNVFKTHQNARIQPPIRAQELLKQHPDA